MQTRAAVIRGIHQDWLIEDVEIDEAGPGEVLIELKACGLCHSDEHVRTGDMPVPGLPMIGGHEGAGEVIAVGPGVSSVSPGDHVAMSFVPACGRCTWCARGESYLCNEGAKLFSLGMMADGTIKHHIGGEPAARFAQLGAFSEQQLLSEHSVVKVDKELPWHAVALVSCGVATGYGAAVDRAGTRPGDVVVVVGVGGVGVAAVQGARLAGAARVVAIDPLASRRDAAKTFGATDAFASMQDAIPAVQQMTRGVMADRVILAPSVVRGEMIDPAMQLTRKGGTCCVTGISAAMSTEVNLNLLSLAMSNKSLVGTVYGSGSPRQRIPFLLDLYRQGLLKIDEMVSKTYTLDEINVGYADQASGAITRGVIIF